MKYYSTNNENFKVGLKQAIVQGLAPDNGLYMPERIPVMSKTFFHELKTYTFDETASHIAIALFGEDIPEEKLIKICQEAINFEAPMVRITEKISTLELFHGPTLAFKDVGARFMARMLGHFTEDFDKEIHVLVATSGDTGSAVANGFLAVPGIRVHVLYPKGLVSPLQEKQFTTLGENITALEVDGNFDDCQRLVKEAFLDPEITKRINLTSANSINLARLLPQSFYYFNAFRQLEEWDDIVICVPSGNFGNLTAGLIARKMGLPVKHFIAANNKNDIFLEYIRTGKYNPRPSIGTIANAMDVGDPSNFVRILDLFNHSHEAIQKAISSYAYSDDQIRDNIKMVYKEDNYLLDPHGATGFMASEQYLKENPDNHLIFLETAHPAKFHESVEPVIGEMVNIPERLQQFMEKKKKSIVMGKNYSEFKKYLYSIDCMFANAKA
jgi:threonine synthase